MCYRLRCQHAISAQNDPLPYPILRLHIRSIGYQQLCNGCVPMLTCKVQWCRGGLHQSPGQGQHPLQLAAHFTIQPHLQPVTATNGKSSDHYAPYKPWFEPAPHLLHTRACSCLPETSSCPQLAAFQPTRPPSLCQALNKQTRPDSQLYPLLLVTR